MVISNVIANQILFYLFKSSIVSTLSLSLGLAQNPDIVLVHYLNVPYSDDNKVISPALNYFADNKKEWTKDELISELKPMCKY